MSEKSHVARGSAIAGGAIAMLKLGVGFWSGSLALISEGFHSTLDFGVTVVTWLSVVKADVPADREHPYGHGKIESLSAFGQAILLVVTAGIILKEGYERLVVLTGHGKEAGEHLTTVTGVAWGAAIGVVATSLVVDGSRAVVLRRAAKKFNSAALDADAMHFGTELVSTFAVLVGLVLIKVGGEKMGWADPVAALVVAGIMMFTALRLGKKSADVLVDKAPAGIEERVRGLIAGVPGVVAVDRVRARQAGARTFVDATISVEGSLDLASGHRISDNVELRVTEVFPEIDILVHVEPAIVGEDHAGVIRKVAEGMGIMVHAVRIREIGGGLYVNFHAEFAGGLTLAESHRRVTELEEKLRVEIKGIAEIESHLEPA